MKNPAPNQLRAIALGLGSLAVSAGIHAAESSRDKRPASGTAQPGAAATTGIADACSFIPKAQLETLLGWELRDGKRKDVSPGMSQCDFTTPPQAYVTRRFSHPPLPAAAGFSSIIITTFPTTPKTFDESRRTMQGEAENTSGLGDAAYWSGPAMIFVRVGNRGFSLRLYVNAPTPPGGKTTLREVILSLARAGAARI